MAAPGTDACFEAATPMLGVEEAVAALLNDAQVMDRTEQVALVDAHGRILAAPVHSPLDVPGFDNSAMDGYALHTRDLAQAHSSGLPIAQRIPAGHIGTPLATGSCARIFTGAAIPEGANTVAIQEVCRVEGERLLLDQELRAQENIRPRGNDIASGTIILKAGTVLRAAQLGLAASVGIDTLTVYCKLRVAIFSTGDELVEPGVALAPGQIYNSNRYQLRALLETQGCNVIDLGTVADTLADTRTALENAAAVADLIITSGGVSVGEEDHVKAALEAIGTLNLWRIRMKPGKPLAFGHARDTAFIGLPGNPVSVFVTFLLFARPYLQRLQGRVTREPQSYPVRAGFSYRAKGRREYVRVQLHHAAEGLTAQAYTRQGSDVLSSVAWADGLVEIAEHAAVQPGDTVRYLPFAEWLQ